MANVWILIFPTKGRRAHLLWSNVMRIRWARSPVEPRNHKPVRMFNARNHRGVSSKMLVKRWSSNKFCQSVASFKKTWILLRYTSNTWWFQKIPQHHFHSKLEILTRYTQIPLILKGTWLEPWANGTPWGRASRQSVEKLSFQCLWKMPEV